MRLKGNDETEGLRVPAGAATSPGWGAAAAPPLPSEKNGKKRGKGFFVGGFWPVPALSNFPFRRYLSNAPYPVPQFALQPQF